jgi:hypothetical protein
MMLDLYAYSFQSDLTLDEIFVRFNQLGPWRWVMRDNDRWGEYISSGVLRDPHYGILKLIVEPDHYAVNVNLKSEDPNAREIFDQVRGTLFDILLSAIGARDLTKVQDYD